MAKLRRRRATREAIMRVRAAQEVHDKCAEAMKAKQLGIHMDKVCPYACNKAKAPDRLAQFWFVRCLEEWKDVE